VQLASKGFNVVVSDMRSDHKFGNMTLENLVFNVDENRAVVEATGGRITALELNWDASEKAPKVDLAVGADIIYEPHLFQPLLVTLKQVANKAVIVQNVNREGTEEFRRFCKDKGLHLNVVPLEESWSGIFDKVEGEGGMYEAWFLELQAR